MTPPEYAPEDPLWYKDAVFYELRVRSFFDSNGDGIGDFPGLTEKLDYFEDLGVTTLWLLPFYPSPQRDDGYDISSYTEVNPEYGSLHDFKVFLKEAHRRGLQVVTELVINHTSDQHPWFQRARRAAPGSRHRDYYVWSDTPERYQETRIIFKDFEPSNWSWDPQAKAYYWHRFYSHQPDLNFDSPDVRREVLRVLDFWLGMGVDGLRLDAVPYLYEREGTNCENLPETHAFLQELRRHVDRRFKGRMLLAEANQWPEDAVAYLHEGKACHMAFHFPLMPRLYLALRTEDRFPLTDIWAQTPPLHETCQWALFLRNHDELTLEMVTEEEREVMYRAYAEESRMRINLGIRRRLAPLLGNNRRSIELLNGLLLSLPGTPVLYYGDEIGMGDNIYLGDRNGVRTPMQWNGDRNAGFSRASSQQLILPLIVDHEYHYEAVNVEAQQRNRHSLYWWMKRLIALRKGQRAFGRGSIEFLNPDNPRVLVFIREYEEERVLVVANLSRFVQLVKLDLSRYKGQIPVELFGRTEFPAIGDKPYFFTLGPHGFYWFALRPPSPDRAVEARAEESVPSLLISEPPGRFLREEKLGVLRLVLATYLRRSRWFAGKARSIKGAEVVETIALDEAQQTILALVRVEYVDGEPETYLLPLAVASGPEAHARRQRTPHMVIAELRGKGAEEPGLLFDASADPAFCRTILEAFGRRHKRRGAGGELRVSLVNANQALRGELNGGLEPHLLSGEQSNTSVVFGERMILKLYRRLEPGVSPELEIGRYLSGRHAFPHMPPLLGWMDYRQARQEPVTLALLQGFVASRGDAWRYTLEELRRFFERAMARRLRSLELPRGSLVSLLDQEPPEPVPNMIGAYLEAARLLGTRVAELHLALGRETEDPAFSRESYAALYQRSTYQSLRNLSGQILRLLRRNVAALPPAARRPARALLRDEAQLLARFEEFRRAKVTVPRIRCHGDLHLGQVLHTGTDFVIIDFEGEPVRPLGERRRKQSGLRDVAGMLRSFHYAAATALLEESEEMAISPRVRESLESCASLWQTWVSWAFLGGYLAAMGSSPLVPREREELRVLLETFLLEKAIYELGYEMSSRPGWLWIPILGIRQIIGG